MIKKQMVSIAPYRRARPQKRQFRADSGEGVKNAGDDGVKRFAVGGYASGLGPNYDLSPEEEHTKRILQYGFDPDDFTPQTNRTAQSMAPSVTSGIDSAVPASPLPPSLAAIGDSRPTRQRETIVFATPSAQPKAVASAPVGGPPGTASPTSTRSTAAKPQEGATTPPPSLKWKDALGDVSKTNASGTNQLIGTLANLAGRYYAKHHGDGGGDDGIVRSTSDSGGDSIEAAQERSLGMPKGGIAGAQDRSLGIPGSGDGWGSDSGPEYSYPEYGSLPGDMRDWSGLSDWGDLGDYSEYEYAKGGSVDADRSGRNQGGSMNRSNWGGRMGGPRPSAPTSNIGGGGYVPPAGSAAQFPGGTESSWSAGPPSMPGAMPNGGGPSSMQGLGPGGPSNAQMAARNMPDPRMQAAMMGQMQGGPPPGPPAGGGMGPMPQGPPPGPPPGGGMGPAWAQGAPSQMPPPSGMPPGMMPNGGGGSSMQGIGPGGPSNAQMASATMPDPRAQAQLMAQLQQQRGSMPTPVPGYAKGGSVSVDVKGDAPPVKAKRERQWGDVGKAAEDLPPVEAKAKGGAIKKRRPASTKKLGKGEKLPVPMVTDEDMGTPPPPPQAAATPAVPVGPPPPPATPPPAMKDGGEVKKAEGGSCEKMAAGGVAKVRHGFPKTNAKPKKMATGGSVRGCGAATKGKGFSGIY